MVSRQRKLHAVLPKVVADRDFSAKSVSSALEPKLVKVIRTSLHKDWAGQLTQPQRISNTLLIAKVRQADQYTVNALLPLTQHLSAQHSVLPGLHRAELGLLWCQRNHLDVQLFQY